MAQTITSVRQTRGEWLNPQGWFTDVWTIEATIDDMDALATTRIGEWDLTVKGLALGDMVLGISSTVDLNDGSNEALMNCYVSAADTLTVQLMADEAEFAADGMNGATVKVIVGRPAW
tara:strand:+ start:88 stop:441 length:354 start_codon:yes stop_codon:yes gene_type:complete